MPEQETGNTVANRALESGTKTSEYQVAEATIKSSRFLTIIGAVMATAPVLLDALNALPAALKDKPWFAIVLACFGGLMALLGIVKETTAKVAYIQSRGLIKAAAIRDLNVEPSTPIDTAKP